MCDTLWYKGKTFNLFAKNSDREPNEAQEIIQMSASHHESNTVQCTYITIPQVSFTHQVLLSKPFQMWGAEMGVNNYGLVIGNEAVFTRIKESKTNSGLTGMDMVRLGLERSESATTALQLIIDLIETYGQDACGGYQEKNFYYHNSFMIADATEAFKLETAGRHWAYKQLNSSDSISNGLTIEGDFDEISESAVKQAYEKGWIKKTEEFSFTKAYSDPFYMYMTKCKIRRKSSLTLLDNHQDFDIENAIQHLSSHSDIKDFNTTKSNASCVCMHPTGLLNPSQTNGSMIVKWTPNNKADIWITGTSMPCLSIYKPWDLDTPINIGPRPGAKFDSSLWWQAEGLHRQICLDYSSGKKIQDEVFQGWQAELLRHKNHQNNKSIWDEYGQKLNILQEKISKANLGLKSYDPFYHRLVKRINRNVGIVFDL